MSPSPTHPDASAPSSRADFSRLEWAALLFVVCCGFSSQMVAPLWISAIITDFGLSAAAAGRVNSFEFMAVAVVSVLVAVNIRRFPTLLTTVVGMVLLLVGNVASAFTPDEMSLTFARVLCGVGKGLVEAVVFSLVAGTSHPTRSFATLNVAYAVFSTFFFFTVPYAIEREGAVGAFHAMGLVALVGTAFLPFFPRQPLSHGELDGFSLRQVPPWGIAAFFVLILLWSGQHGLMAFIERFGDARGMNAREVGQILGLAAFLTIAGPTIARVVETRFGFTPPMLLAITILIGATFVLGHSATRTAFTLAVPLFMLMPLLITPYLMGVLSLADPAGRLSAASSAAMTAGSSMGAWLGGMALTGGGLGVLSWTSIGHFAICALIILVIAPLATRRGAKVRAAAAGALGDPE
ncbi:MFS transporter [Novosphingobium aquimarinum]|uniref:MFS transporter n=1 Tax=Novosphingobium aquimarinum TaxID=2682494 RepID=UPI0012ECA367|nr:MFS transporter [Novosphingobium aquimarinum]